MPGPTAHLHWFREVVLRLSTRRRSRKSACDVCPFRHRPTGRSLAGSELRLNLPLPIPLFALCAPLRAASTARSPLRGRIRFTVSGCGRLTRRSFSRVGVCSPLLTESRTKPSRGIRGRSAWMARCPSCADAGHRAQNGLNRPVAFSSECRRRAYIIAAPRQN
jgi:hypothetical protein